jgi:hypothetical protein
MIVQWTSHMLGSQNCNNKRLALQQCLVEMEMTDERYESRGMIMAAACRSPHCLGGVGTASPSTLKMFASPCQNSNQQVSQ